jgi:PAS domain S-box-containing protein
MDAKTERSKLTTWFFSKPRTSGFLVFLLLFFVVAYIIFQRYQIVKENDRREMSNILHVVYENVEQSLKNSSTAALTLALSINDEGKLENFDEVAKQIIASNPDIDAVQLVPDGIISHVYPYEINKGAIGFNVLESKENRNSALESMANKKMYFAGPLKLKQGGVGVIGRLPVFLKGRFWGFSGILIRMKNLIKISGIHRIDESKYYFQFSHTNAATHKKEFFLPNKDDFSGKYYDSVVFPDSDWTLYIISKNENNNFFVLLPLAVSGILLTSLFGFLISMLLRKPAELQLKVLKQTRKLLNSEIKFKAIFEQAAVGITNVDTETGNIIEANEHFCSMLGYSRGEIKGMNVHAITHPNDMQTGFDNIEKLKSGELGRFSFEKRYLTKSGDFVWVNVTVSPLWRPGEKPTTQIAIVEDITLRKEAKEQIAKSEARFKSLFEDSPVALWEEDFSEVKKYIARHHPDLNAKNAEAYFDTHPEAVRQCISFVKIIDVNNECLELHKPSSKKELVNTNLVTLLDGESIKSFIKQLVAIVKGSNLITMQTRIANPGGGYCDIYMRWSVMRGYEDTLERVIISTEDITAQKESERIIVNSQQRVEDLINSIDGIVWECDAETFKLTFISKKVEDILGYTAEEWAADHEFWENHIHPEDKEMCINVLHSVAKENKRQDFEYRIIAKDGSIVWIQDFMNVGFENGKPANVRGIMIDITKTKVAEEDLSNSLELVTEQKKRLMNFSYIVSHNLRSHTANIQSITALIQEADSDEERNEMIAMLKTVSASLNETIINLNELVNIQANVTLAVETLNLKHYIENTENVLSEQIDSKHVKIINNIPNDVAVNYNPAYLESTMLNLFSNAIRYSHPDRKPIITLDWLEEEGKNVLQVSDNGIGIDLKKHGDKLFGMYKTFNGNADARGIGLFMTRSQVEAMNGKITVESESGIGTTFKIRF